MSLALDSGRIEGSGFAARGMQPCIPVYVPDPSEDRRSGDRPKVSGADDFSSTSSSSIGRNSSSGTRSSSSEGEDSGEAEVQSSYKGPLDAMNSLEESLPIRRGISNFYAGKSKSFTSLSDAAVAAAAKDLAKPESPYNRKRKNLLLRSNIWERNHHLDHSLRNSGNGIAKRPANSCRSTLALAVTMSSSEKEDANGGEEQQQRQQLPPLPPNGRSSSHSNHCSYGSNTSPPQWSFASRSFSLVDLQGATSSACRREKHNDSFHY